MQTPDCMSCQPEPRRILKRKTVPSLCGWCAVGPDGELKMCTFYPESNPRAYYLCLQTARLTRSQDRVVRVEVRVLPEE
jgi:hypothetical protein